MATTNKDFRVKNGLVVEGATATVNGSNVVTESSTSTLTNKTLTSPILTTPSIGVATGTSFNSITGLSSTAPSSDGTAAVGTATTTARADHVHPTDTSRAATAGTLSQFAATTSAQLAGVISDETGSGALVFATSPTLVTPVLGAASATSLSLTNALTATNGGTGQSTYTTGDILITSATNTLSKLAAVTSGYVLTSNGVGTAPSWQVSGGGTSLPSQAGNAGELLTTDGTSASWSNTLIANATTSVGLIVKGLASQTGDLLQVQNSAGTSLFEVTSAGSVGIGITTPSGFIHARRDSGAGDSYITNSILQSTDQRLTLKAYWQSGVGQFAAIDSSTDSGGAQPLVIQTGGTERMRIAGDGTATFAGQIQSTRANSTADAGGQLYLNGATGNRIDFNVNGVAAPSFTTRSAGTKIVLYPAISGSTIDYALGIESGNMWLSSNAGFKWYSGITNIATLSSAGLFTAVSKSFDIEHPTKPDMRLRYGSLEGPENGVYIRGKSKNKTITLPDYWTGLVHEDTITASLTSIGSGTIYVEEIIDNTVKVGGTSKEFFFTIYGERKDIDKITVEY